jgi:hypothetical protein
MGCDLITVRWTVSRADASSYLDFSRLHPHWRGTQALLAVRRQGQFSLAGVGAGKEERVHVAREGGVRLGPRAHGCRNLYDVYNERRETGEKNTPAWSPLAHRVYRTLKSLTPRGRADTLKSMLCSTRATYRHRGRDTGRPGQTRSRLKGLLAWGRQDLSSAHRVHTCPREGCVCVTTAPSCLPAKGV